MLKGQEEKRLLMYRTAWACVAAAVLAATLCPAVPVAARSAARPVFAYTLQPTLPTTLSPYWPTAVRRWEPFILTEAERRGVDPDLIAAVIWKESNGLAYRRGPAGGAGLMMVMPKEAGFAWRPTAEQLMIPEVNLFWGVRALSIIIRQSGGDLFQALAAYNGGWEQVDLRVTQRYAGAVLLEYAKAVAVRNGLPPNGYWVATVAALHSPDVLTVIGPQRELGRYPDCPIMAVVPDAHVEGPPTAVAFWPPDGVDLGSSVGIWISVDGWIIRSPAQVQPDGESRSSPAGREGWFDLPVVGQSSMW